MAEADQDFVRPILLVESSRLSVLRADAVHNQRLQTRLWPMKHVFDDLSYKHVCYGSHKFVE